MVQGAAREPVTRVHLAFIVHLGQLVGQVLGGVHAEGRIIHPTPGLEAVAAPVVASSELNPLTGTLRGDFGAATVVTCDRVRVLHEEDVIRIGGVILQGAIAHGLVPRVIAEARVALSRSHAKEKEDHAVR